jgi:hypothetical protein
LRVALPGRGEKVSTIRYISNLQQKKNEDNYLMWEEILCPSGKSQPAYGGK